MLLYALWVAVVVTYLNRTLLPVLPDILEKDSDAKCLVSKPNLITT